MHNYIDKWTCIAMMNKNCTLLKQCLGFSKTKNGSKVSVFSLDYAFDPNMHKQVSWLYLNNEPNKQQFDSVYSLEEIVSRIDGHTWFWKNDEKRPKDVLAGEKFIEWRGTVNKWHKAEITGCLCIESLNDSNLDATLSMIEKWRYLDNGGMKYGWQERAGCDKALVKRYVSNFENICEYVNGLVFKLNNEVVGYSCIEKKSLCSIDGFPELKYLTRKVLNLKGFRNLTEYIDYKTIEYSYRTLGCPEVLLVNWGASSGGVHWYKTHKFPVYSIEKKWFATKKAK